MPAFPDLTRRTALAAMLAPPWLVQAKVRPDDAVRADADARSLADAIAGPQRSAANRARDDARHPFETLRFFGLAPGQTVIEVGPGSGWYTEILAPYLRLKGRLYAAHFPADSTDDYEHKGLANYKAKLAAAPAVYDRVVLGELAVDGRLVGVSPRGGADRVLTFRNVHNWIEAGHLDTTLRAMHAALKPGGVLGIEEHRAPSGTDLTTIIKIGYVPEDFVIDRARAAGFEMAGGSEVNANPRDTKDHPDGVWSLPPTLRGGNVDRARFIAIGESDRMTLRFVKPG
jgi:predicted methyltransferase